MDSTSYCTSEPIKKQEQNFKHGICQTQQEIFQLSTPHRHDVLSGRGSHTKKHPGNRHFLALVRMHKILYVLAPRNQRIHYARTIVNAIRTLDPPGRFLKQDPMSKLWRNAEDKEALEKTMQALRDGAPELVIALKRSLRLSCGRSTKLLLGRQKPQHVTILSLPKNDVQKKKPERFMEVNSNS